MCESLPSPGSPAGGGGGGGSDVPTDAIEGRRGIWDLAEGAAGFFLFFAGAAVTAAWATLAFFGLDFLALALAFGFALAAGADFLAPAFFLATTFFLPAVFFFFTAVLRALAAFPALAAFFLALRFLVATSHLWVWSE